MTSTASTEILLFIFCVLQNGRGKKYIVLKMYTTSGGKTKSFFKKKQKQKLEPSSKYQYKLRRPRS